MKTALTIYVTICLLATACEPIEQPKVHVYTERDTIFVTAKRIEHIGSNFWGKGYDKYIIAFSNMETRASNFAEYECIEIGDTIFRHKLNTEYFWNYEYKCQ